MTTHHTHPPRIILLTTARTYRSNAFLDAAERLGIEVLQVQDMATELAAHWNHQLAADFTHPDAAAQQIAAIARATPITAIRAVDDSGTLVAAKASARLGLPHNSPQAAQAARDKHLMRTLFAAADVPCPWFQRFSTNDDAHAIAQQVPYPCVVKPLSLSGSRGVIRANDPAGFVAAVARLTQVLTGVDATAEAHPYLVEEFIPGVEVALEGMLDGGKLAVLALFDKPDPLDGPFFEETIYVTPSRLSDDVQTAIHRCVARAAEALGLREGPVHAELRVNDRGPWMLEIAGRSIGGLCSQTLRFGVDTSLEELILRQACGLPLHMERESRANGVMMIPIPEAGILKGVAGVAEAEAVDGIASVEITAKLNYSLVPLPEGESYLGFIFAHGATPDIVETALRDAHAKLHFTILPELTLMIEPMG